MTIESFVQNNLLLMQLENFQSGHHEMVSLTSDILISKLIRNPMIVSAQPYSAPNVIMVRLLGIAIVEKYHQFVAASMK